MGTRKAKTRTTALRVPVSLIERRIFVIRGQRVMLDADLAELYSVETRTLVQAVKRNRKRFPSDFMFPLTLEETEGMRSQIVIASKRNIRHRPLAFTEHGVAMLSAVLRSAPAVMMSILIVRAFIMVRNRLATDHELRSRVGKLESGQRRHGSVIKILANEVIAMKRLPAAPPKPPIGFKPNP